MGSFPHKMYRCPSERDYKIADPQAMDRKMLLYIPLQSITKERTHRIFAPARARWSAFCAFKTPPERVGVSRGLALTLGVLAAGVVLTGCDKSKTRDGSEKELADYRETAGSLFGPGTPNTPPPDFDNEDDGSATPPARDRGPDPFATGAQDGWSIVLGNVPGSDRVIAEQMLAGVRSEGGIPSAFVAERGGKLFIATGQFPDPTSRDAQRELERVRGLTLRGGRPYGFAFLAPPASEPSATESAHDLRNAAKAFGTDALYTLQIGVYGYTDGRPPSPEDLALFRKTAEQAVRDLRAQGELAFYYHDRTRSTVTVGIFGPEDHDPSVRPPFESPRLVQTRRRHEFSLLNGQGVNQIVRGTDGRQRRVLQKSFLVAVPK
ncbi:MAG: hypothetical protein DHS20C14_21800 [Phycisphaeraceae bacterium]|nr:MAG: hypothetical protein DHS20C14_21800 [Phycisphaeraceae bacterium]